MKPEYAYLQACGYMDGQETSIFDPVVPPPRRTSMLAASGSAVISYDDRMLLHDENLQPLHPERADRLRAVMARLDAAQLTGGPCVDGHAVSIFQINTNSLRGCALAVSK